MISANLEKRQLDYEWVLTATLDEGDEEKIKHKPKRKKKKHEE